MTTSMEAAIPDNAPIVQLLLTVSFLPALPDLSIIDLADFYALFRQEYPVFRQVARAGPMSFSPMPEMADLGHMVGPPRLAFSTEETERQVLFQNDRLSYGWNRTSSLKSGPNYPGFSASFETLVRHLDVLRNWSSGRGIEIRPAVAEIVYTDAFTLQSSASENPTPLPELFTFMNPASLHPIMGFDYSWTEQLPSELSGYIQASAAGPALSPEGVPVATLETTSYFDASTKWDQLDQKFERAHQAIHGVYERVVNQAVRARS